jgi:PAS domain S-box-containing protein
MSAIQSKRQSPGTRLRALVVEDSQDDFDLLVAFLGRGPWQLEARRVEDEPGLRRALAETDWDVVISDHHLPRFDSTSALRIVRELEADAPFIIVSGQIGEDVAVDAMLAGADDYVMKHNLARLRPALQRCLAGTELRRQKLHAEARERESESRLEAIAAHLPGVVFQLRQSRAAAMPEFVYLSDGAAKLLGQAPAVLLANPGRIMHLTANAAGEPLAARLAACARSGEALAWEGRLGGHGGALRWVSVSASPREIGNGARVWDGIMVDITALKHAEQELRESRQRLSELSAHWERHMEEERTAIARELHDDVGGTLAALKVDIDWLRRRTAEGSPLQERIRGMNELVENLIDSSVRLARDLRAAALDYGIAAALEVKCAELGRRLGIPCRFRTNVEDLALAPEPSAALFRVVQEALTNVTKHAHASRVDVELFATGRELTVEVRDDGRGMEPGALAKPDSFGIRGMRERVERLGGWLDVSGAPGKGTTVMVGIPGRMPEAAQ